jgi:hypothetical protein
MYILLPVCFFLGIAFTAVLTSVHRNWPSFDKVSGMNVLCRLALCAAAALSLSAECRTSLGVPCFTARITQTQWQLFRNGPADIRKFVRTSVDAVREDSSSVTVQESSYGSPFNTAERPQKVSSLYLAPDKQIVFLDHNARTIGRREPLSWQDLPYRRSKNGDTHCESGIRHSGTDFTRGETAVVAGIPAVRWYRSLANGGSEEIYLAPSVDCLTLKARTTMKNEWHLPVFINTMEVTSVELGEPRADLFALPSDYREIEHPHRQRLLRLHRAPQ